jgi:hypothetical protein
LKSSKTVQVFGDVVVAGFNTEYAWANHQGIDRNGNKIERKSGKDYWFLRTIEKNKDKLLELYNERLEIRLKAIYG